MYQNKVTVTVASTIIVKWPIPVNLNAKLKSNFQIFSGNSPRTLNLIFYMVVSFLYACLDLCLSRLEPTAIMFLPSSAYLRGCLSKTAHSILREKIFLPETLASERLYQDYN